MSTTIEASGGGVVGLACGPERRTLLAVHESDGRWASVALTPAEARRVAAELLSRNPPPSPTPGNAPEPDDEPPASR
jgi:hypothetical protein